MIGGQSVLAVIPARGGSKRIPQKNLQAFRSRWIVSWSADAAKGSKYIDKWFVSTENFRIECWARSLGFPVIERPVELATDTASNESVLRHALSLHPADWIVLLQPTSPLRESRDIDRCLELAQTTGVCVSVRPDGTRNGAVYAARSSWIAEHDFGESRIFYEMPLERSLDIDYPHQLEEVAA